MSLPERMDCIKDQCRAPLACSGWGYCREWNMLSAREYEVALEACRERGIKDPWAKKAAHG